MKGEDGSSAGRVRLCTAVDAPKMLQVVNAAAHAHRGEIPPDRWREPYMPAEELASEIADGVVFSGCEIDGALMGVMGVQRRWNVDLIRHAYVLPCSQGRGIGSSLLTHLTSTQAKPVLVGRGAQPCGRCASMSATASPARRLRWSPPCYRPTGACRSGRSRPRWCCARRR